MASYQIDIVQAEPRQWHIRLDGCHLGWRPTFEEAHAFACGASSTLFALRPVPDAVFTSAKDLYGNVIDVYEFSKQNNELCYFAQ